MDIRESPRGSFPLPKVSRETQVALEEALLDLRERTRYLDAFFENSLTPLVLLDRDFNFIRVNEAYAKAVGRRPEDFLGHNHFELYPSDAQIIFEEVVRSRQPFKVEARPFEYPDHPERGLTYWDWTLTPLLDSSGEVEALVFALDDVTDRVRKTRHGWRDWSMRFSEPWVTRRRKAIWVVPVGIALQVLLFLGLGMLASPAEYLGIPGPAAVLIGVVVAISAGPVAGGFVAFVGGLAYMALLAEFGRAVIWPTIVGSIALWILVSVVAGLAAEWVRRRAAAREVQLSQAVKDRDALMESLRRTEREQRRIAETLQQAFSHIPSEIGTLKLSHLYRSATEAARIGGDFYDVFEAKDGRIAVLIGDVAGHGIEAARTATLVKDVIHAFTHLSVRTHEVLRRTNQLLVEKDRPGFVSVFLGILTADGSKLQYCSAGHPETLLRRVSGEIELLGHGSSPLGVYPEATWKQEEVELLPGDLLFLYTDGIIEARQDGEFFGEERLQVLIGQSSVGLAQLPQFVLDEVLAFSSGSLHDDLAILALSMDEPARGSGVERGA